MLVTHEIPTAAAREALRIGRDGGAWTMLNPAPADGIDRTMLSLADVVTPNRGELARLVGGRRAPVRPAPRTAARTRSGRPTLLETTSDGPGAGRAFLVSLGVVGGGARAAGRPGGRHRGARR